MKILLDTYFTSTLLICRIAARLKQVGKASVGYRSVIILVFFIPILSSCSLNSELKNSGHQINLDSIEFEISTHTQVEKVLQYLQAERNNEHNSEDSFNIQYLIALALGEKGSNNEALNILDSLLIENSKKQNVDPKHGLLLELYGRLLFKQGKFESSRQYFKRTLVVDSVNRDTSRLIKGFSNLSSIEHNLENYSSAANYQLKAIDLASEFLGDFYVINLKTEFAATLLELGYLDSAKSIIEEALRMRVENADTFGLILNLGLIEEKKGHFPSAYNLYQSALNIAYKENDRSDIALALNNLAYIAQNLGLYRDGFNYLDSSISVERRIQDLNLAKSIRDLELKYEDLERDNRLQSLEFQTESDQQMKQWGGLTAVLVIAGLGGLYFTNRKRLLGARQLAEETKIRHLKEKELVALHTELETLELERKRIAMDLHDGIGALASSARIRVSQVTSRIESPQLKELLSETDHSLNEIALDVKRIAYNMLPTTLSYLGLVATIEDYIEKCNKSNEIELAFFSDVESIKLPENMEIALYRIVQELVNNGIKYSKGKEMMVELLVNDSFLELRYNDDGIGIEGNNPLSGNGLNILKSRVAFLNGTIALQSEKGKGTTFFIEIPYEPKN